MARKKKTGGGTPGGGGVATDAADSTAWAEELTALQAIYEEDFAFDEREQRQYRDPRLPLQSLRGLVQGCRARGAALFRVP